MRHSSTGLIRQRLRALYCQISDLGSDSDRNRALGHFTIFSFFIIFARNWEYMLVFGRENVGGTIIPSISGGDMVFATSSTDTDI